MNQVVKDKMAREIMVVKNDYLFEENSRESRFYPRDGYSFEKVVLDKYEFMVRGEAEVNFEYKQPIGYAFVMDEENRVFVYKRGDSNSNAGDARLHSKMAMGVGGHIEKEDENSKNPISDSLVREVEEELDFKPEDIKDVELIGYINSEDDKVSQVHIGFAYVVKVHHTDFALLDGELENGEFLPIEKIEEMMAAEEYDFEAWSVILLDPLKEILKKA